MTFDQTFEQVLPLQTIENKAQIDAPKKKRSRGDAITRLCKAISRNMRDNSDDLAEKLFDRALEGDVNCTKLLIALIERLPKPKSRKVDRLLLELAKEPEWKGPPELDPCDECELRDCDHCNR